ncbi:hypothetical protein FRB91_006725 [Serendipita sp. 411]|nr:hypothetical protein FRB91_006725 [Serendipita sp. 411]
MRSMDIGDGINMLVLGSWSRSFRTKKQKQGEKESVEGGGGEEEKLPGGQMRRLEV